MKSRKTALTSLRVLGIDPGGSITGWGLVRREGATLILEDSGVIRTKRGEPFSKRLRQLHEGLSDVLGRTTPDAVAIESVFHAQHARSALQLGHARGVLILAAAQAEIEPFEYPPSTVKKAVTGDGSADKEQVRKMVTMLLGADISGPSDQTDALAVAICHAQAGSFASKLRALGRGGAGATAEESRAATAPRKLRRRRG